MRIIRGKYGHRRFRVASSFNARPTTDFAKENLFNVLDNIVEWEGMEALDLFAGTGSIAFELISRGCRKVTAVELNHAHASFIAQVTETLEAEEMVLVRGDVFRFLRTVKPLSYDLIFADPPYELKALADLPQLIMEGNLLREEGLFILEHSRQNDFSSSPTFRQKREYGAVNFSFFSKSAR